MNAVMISIQPQWVERILTGEKTIEIRKTKPNINLPCKVYIYETKGREFPFNVKIDTVAKDDNARWLDCKRGMPPIRTRVNSKGVEIPYIAYGRAKVVAEFTLKEIEEYELELWDKNTFESIGRVYYDFETGEREVDVFETEQEIEETKFAKESNLTLPQLRKYLGQGISTCYAWRIDDLKVYDNPKELNEFRYSNCELCKHIKFDPYNTDNECCRAECKNLLKKPPQSWCYVEDK